LPPSTVLPDNLLPEILAKSGDGLCAAEIAAYLLERYQITVSPGAIRNRIRRVQAERAPITAAILADKLSRTVGIDLDRIEAAILRALEDELDAREDAREFLNGKATHLPGSDSWSKIMHVVKASRGDLTRLVELRLKLAGADDGSGKRPDAADVQNRLISKFDALVEKRAKAVESAPKTDAPGVH